MSTALDIRMRELARRLINERYGKSMTLKKMGSASYDTATASVTPGTNTTAIKGVILDPSDNAIASGSDVQVGDRFIMIAAKGLTDIPAPNDTLVIDGEDWAVLRVSPTYSGEDIALYSVQVRT